MSLRIAVSHPSWSATHQIPASERVPVPCCCAVGSRSSSRSNGGRVRVHTPVTRRRSSSSTSERVGGVASTRASLEAVAGTEKLIGTVTEVNKDTFWPIVKGAGHRTVVLDMYTQWCGPCKIMAPKFLELAQKYEDVIFLKLDCNQENKPLAKELGIRVVPTFKILKDNNIVKEVTGAKFDDLVAAIETARAN